MRLLIFLHETGGIRGLRNAQIQGQKLAMLKVSASTLLELRFQHLFYTAQRKNPLFPILMLSPFTKPPSH